MPQNKYAHRSPAFYILWTVVVILVGSGIVIWRNFKYKLVNKKLDQLVTVKSKGLYQINYEKLVIDEVLGNISAENIEMIPDSLIYQSMVEQKTAPSNLFFINIPKLVITGVKTPKALLNKEISGHLIKIINAKIEIRLPDSKNNKETDLSKNIRDDLSQQLLVNLKSIDADSVILENADLTIKNGENKTISILAQGLNIRFAGIRIDSSSQNDSNRILFSRDLVVQCEYLDIPFKNKAQDLQIKGMVFESQYRHFHMDKISLFPLLSETAFARSNKYAKDRFNIELGSLDVWQLNRERMLHQELIADSITINKATLKVFRDKSFTHDSVDRTHDFPQEAIMRLPMPVNIKKVIIKDSYIEYKEKNDKSDSSGKVAFFHVHAVLNNITNIPSQIRLNNAMTLDFHASFLNEAPLNVTIRMRLNDVKGNFSLNAKMNAIEAEKLNPLLKPMALVELNKGRINSLQYHMDATNTKAKGKLILNYENISVRLLKKDDDNNKYKTKVLPTLAAGFILKDSNPKNGKTRIGHVEYDRDIHRSIFNLMWKSLLSGIKEVAL
jgi:hypothetical protein